MVMQHIHIIDYTEPFVPMEPFFSHGNSLLNPYPPAWIHHIVSSPRVQIVADYDSMISKILC
jgi:hypothetical protein